MRIAASCLAWLMAVGCAHPGAPDAASTSGPNGWTLERVLSRPTLTGTPPSNPLWSPDGRHLAFLWKADAQARREIWLVEVDAEPAGGGALRELTAGGDGASGVEGFAWMPDGGAIVHLRDGALWRTDLAGNASLVRAVGEGASDLDVAPDGRHASFLKAGDLWLVDLADRTLRRATHVGVPSISDVPLGRYRRPDVEIGPYVWGGPTYAWSPDGRSIAVHHVDRRGLRAVPFPHYLGEETSPNLVRRSYPGDPNEARSVGLLDVESGALRMLVLPDPTATRIVDFSWSRDGRLLIDRESDTCVDRFLHVLDPEAREPRLVWHDRRESRVYTAGGSAWHVDGDHVVVLADLADRYGLYAVHREGGEPRLLTDASCDVLGGPLVARNGAIFYAANDPRPSELHACVTSLDGAPRRLTSQPGESRPYPSPDGRHLAILHSSDTSPTELHLLEVPGQGGSGPARRITRSPSPEFEALARVEPRYVTFPSLVDDAVLHARILEPRDLDRSRRHPVIFGPVYSNTVRNRWSGLWSMLQQVLVDRGFVVVQVDVRGSTGYGRSFREEFLMDFAGRDLDDLASAVAYMESLPHIDPDRIGIWGSSYGGTLTVYALLKKPGLFDAGVACAAAVDPHFFGSDDVAIVRRPDSHPEAFLRGAAQYAANLEDPLLLVHGMQDQVVPFKTVVDLAEALMLEGKDFDFAFAPAGTHRWSGPPHYARYLLGKLVAHFERHLRGGSGSLAR
jgi:dipeptidyl-peptidase-4